jgi:hypothetical protein
MKVQVTIIAIRICRIFTSFWKIGCKAISSDTDYQMYDIRLLSIVKEAEDTHKQLLTKPKSSRRFAKQHG